MISTQSRQLVSSDEQLPDMAGRVGALRSFAALNLGVRFGVELATFAALGYWGASANDSEGVRALLAVIAPLVAIVAWSRLLAPRTPKRLTGRAALFVELSIFAGASAALVSSGRRLVSVVYVSVAVPNSFLTRALGQYAPAGGVPALGNRP
jgi:hypothetical protein